MSAPILTTPDQHDLVDPTVERNPRRLRDWLGQLPLMNVAESARLAANALDPLNEQRLAPDERLALLEVYRPTVGKLFETSGPIKLRQLPMAKADRQQAVDMVERLCLALAGGYKVVVLAWYGDVTKHKLPFHMAVRGAVELLTLALVHSYRYHRPVPPFVFLELHQLYRLARYHGLLNEPAEAGDIPIASHYQAALMLAMTDPFHLGDGVADQYHRGLVRYAGLARMVPGSTWEDDGEGWFALDLRGDSPPRPCIGLPAQVDNDEPYLMDARPSFQAMHQHLLSLPADKRARSPEAALLRILMPEVPRRRKDRRTADGRWLDVLTGIEAIHGHLSQAAAAAPQAMRVMDASDGGLRLRWGGSGVEAMLVGDVIGIVGDSADQLPRLQLAVVRWVRSERTGSTDMGVELQDGQPGAVSCRPVDDLVSPPWACLFLPSRPGGGAPAALIAYKDLYQPERRLLLNVGQREVAVRATGLVTESPRIDRFTFASDSAAG